MRNVNLFGSPKGSIYPAAITVLADIAEKINCDQMRS